MTSFDRFHAVHKRHQNSLSCVFSARTIEGEEVILKISDPPLAVLGQDEVQAINNRFIERAQTQQKVAANEGAQGKSHWAPIHDTGFDQGRAYYTTDFYPLCANDLIRGRVSVNHETLHTIVTSVVAGLRELEAVCDRPHGNLKPSNILIGVSNAAKIAAKDIALTDLLANSRVKDKEGRINDQRRLGQLIYQLVTFQKPPGPGGLPVNPSDHWLKLGRQSDEWMALCNHLLDSKLEEDCRSLEALSKRLESLKPRVYHHHMVVLAALIGLIVAALVLYVPDNEPITWTVDDQEVWLALCNEYELWFGLLSGGYDDKRRSAYYADNRLTPIAELLDQAGNNGDEVDPKVIAGISDQVDRRGLGVPEQIKTKAAKQSTRNAVGKLTKVKSYLRKLGDPNKPWPRLAQLKDIISTLEQLQWHGPAIALRRLRLPQRMSDNASLVDVIKAIDLLIQIGPQLEQIESDIIELRELSETICNTGDPFLEGFDRYLQQQLQSEITEYRVELIPAVVITQLQAMLDEAHELNQLIDNYWHHSIDRAAFLDHRSLELDTGQSLSSADIEQWKAAIQSPDYQLLDQALDPRQSWLPIEDGSGARQPATLPGIRRSVEWLQDNGQAHVLIVVKPGLEDGISIDGQLTAIVQELAALDQMPWNPITRQEVELGVQALDDKIRRLQGVLSRELEILATSFDDYVAQLREQNNIVATGSQTLGAMWVEHRDQQIKVVVPNEFAKLKQNISRLKVLLVKIDSAFTSNLTETLRPREWNTSLAQSWLPSVREQAIQSLVQDLDINDILTRDNKQWLKVLDRHVMSYMSRRQDAIRFLGDFNQLEDLLNAGYRLDEQPEQGDSIIELFTHWQYSDLLAGDREFAEIMSPLIERVDRLIKLRNDLQPSSLISTANDYAHQDIALAMAAWRQLGRLDRWPATRQDLDSEQKLIQRLNVAAARVKESPKRSISLAQELTEGARARWLSYFSAINDTDEINRCLDVRTLFNVDDVVLQSYPRLYFNLMLNTISQPPANLSKQQLVDWTSKQLQNIKELTPRLDPKLHSIAKNLADELEVLVSQSQYTQGLDPTTMGPAKLDGWTGRKLDDAGRRLGYSWQSPQGSQHDMVYERVDLDSGASIYMSTTEVSVKLFSDVVSANNLWPQVTGIIGEENHESEQYGPRVWAWIDEDNPDRGIRVAEKWYPPPSIPTNLEQYGPIYAEGLRYDPVMSLEDQKRIRAEYKASLDHPVQHISAVGSWWFAHVMGGRLPTSMEWQAAQVTNEQEAINLRDRTWQQQLDHIKQTKNRGGINYQWPDDGIFLPDDTIGLDVPEYQDATSRDTNDRHLWFMSVDDGAGKPFNHLTGNVAEFVYDFPKRFDEVAQAEGGAERFSELLNGEGLAVIGGSAISPPELMLDKPYPLDRFDFKRGFSDVGLRLVFDMPEPTFAMKLHSIYKQYSYIRADGA